MAWRRPLLVLLVQLLDLAGARQDHGGKDENWDMVVQKAAMKLSLDECSSILKPHCYEKGGISCVDCVGRLKEKTAQSCTLMAITMFCYGDKKPKYGHKHLNLKDQVSFVTGEIPKREQVKRFAAKARKAAVHSTQQAFVKLEDSLKLFKWTECEEKSCSNVFKENIDTFKKELPVAFVESRPETSYGSCNALTTRLMVLARMNIRQVASPGGLDRKLKNKCQDYYHNTQKCLSVKKSDPCAPVCKYKMVHGIEDQAEMYLIKEHNACSFAALMTGLGASILEPARSLCVKFSDRCDAASRSMKVKKKKKAEDAKKVEVVVKPHKVPDASQFDQCQHNCCEHQTNKYRKKLEIVGCSMFQWDHSPRTCNTAFSVISDCIVHSGHARPSIKLPLVQHEAWSRLLAKSKDLCLFGMENYLRYLGIELESYELAYMYPANLCHCFDHQCNTK